MRGRCLAPKPGALPSALHPEKYLILVRTPKKSLAAKRFVPAEASPPLHPEKMQIGCDDLMKVGDQLPYYSKVFLKSQEQSRILEEMFLLIFERY